MSRAWTLSGSCLSGWSQWTGVPVSQRPGIKWRTAQVLAEVPPPNGVTTIETWPSIAQIKKVRSKCHRSQVKLSSVLVGTRRNLPGSSPSRPPHRYLTCTCWVYRSLSHLYPTTHQLLNLKARNCPRHLTWPLLLTKSATVATTRPSLALIQHPVCHSSRPGQANLTNYNESSHRLRASRKAKHGQRTDIAAIPGRHSTHIGAHNTIFILFGNAGVPAGSVARGYTEVTRGGGRADPTNVSPGGQTEYLVGFAAQRG